jgi:glucose-1-phosphate adenylyltransferase
MELLSEKTLTMILCGGKGERLYPLTRDRAKPSVPFLGAYRIIDFSLSSALNSGLRRIALLTQYKSLSLERHILNGWNIFHAESGDYIISLPAQGRVGDHWYEGTADAVFQNIYTIQQENPEAVLVLSGDHVYNADYRKLLQAFSQSQADALIMTRVVPVDDATRFGVIGVDAERRIIQFLEKPKKPFPTPWDPGKSLISMGVYLFKTPVLIKALIRDALDSRSNHDFGRNILPSLIASGCIFAYPFEDYWEDIGTIDAYWKANMVFLDPEPPFLCGDDSWLIRTYRRQYPPSFFHQADIQNSIIGSGCRIRGATVRHSIISPGVEIAPDARVESSIIFEGSRIGPGSRLRRVIVDKSCQIPGGFESGFRVRKDRAHFMISPDGIRVIPKNWRVE